MTTEVPITWQNRESAYHSKIFDPLSRPLSRTSQQSKKTPQSTATSERADDNDMGLFNGNRIRWNHLGKKYTLRISDYEMDYADIFDAFMKKVYEARPDFEGGIAWIDQFGRQSVISGDRDLRDALAVTNGKLKVHTMVSDGSVIAAADLVRQRRSHSVPPQERNYNYNTYPPHSRSPSSIESAPVQSYRRRTLTPPPIVESPVAIRKPDAVYHQVPPPGYTYKYTTYGPYTQPILYGMPPTNGMLMRFLLNPFTYGYNRSWIGPYKYWGWGGWGPLW